MSDGDDGTGGRRVGDEVRWGGVGAKAGAARVAAELLAGAPPGR